MIKNKIEISIELCSLLKQNLKKQKYSKSFNSIDKNTINNIIKKYETTTKEFYKETTIQENKKIEDSNLFANKYTKLLETNTHHIMSRLEASYALFLEDCNQKYKNDLNTINEKFKNTVLNIY